MSKKEKKKEIHHGNYSALPKQPSLYNSPNSYDCADSFLEVLESILTFASDSSLDNIYLDNVLTKYEPHSTIKESAPIPYLCEKLGVSATSQWSSFAMQYKRTSQQLVTVAKNENKKTLTELQFNEKKV